MQYNEIPNFVWSAQPAPATDLTGNQYRGVKLVAGAGGGTPAVISGATNIVVGFQTTKVNGAGQAISLESNGIVLARCGAAVTAGLEVTIMATGDIENKNGSNTIVGHALASGVTGDRISIKLKNM